MTTTSLKHIVSNVENIRNPVITHCYYGNQPLLSFLFSLCLCFPFVLCAFAFVPFFCNRCLFLVFATQLSFSVFARPLIFVAFHFAYHPLDPHLLSAFYLFGKHLSFGSDQWYADAFRTLCLVSAPFIYSFLRNII